MTITPGPADLTMEGLAKMAMDSDSTIRKVIVNRTDDPSRYIVRIVMCDGDRAVAMLAAQEYINARVSPVYLVEVQ